MVAVSLKKKEGEAARDAGESYRPKSFDDFDQISEVVDDEYLQELEMRQEERNRRRRAQAAKESGGVAGEATAGE